MDDFPKQIHRAVNLLNYGIEKTEVAKRLTSDGVDQVRAILITLAAQQYIKYSKKDINKNG